MKVALVSPYLLTLGGGERYLFSVADFFQQRNDFVEILTNDTIDVQKVQDRFNINLRNIKFKKDVFNSQSDIVTRLLTSLKYDLIFFVSDGSVPSSLAAKNILHFQIPFRYGKKDFLTHIKLSRFQHIVCNSFFTKKFIDSAYGITSEVIYPPVDVKAIKPGKKTNTILAVGRFFSPSHPKKQEAMIDAFISMFDKGLTSWKFIVAGGITGKDAQDAISQLSNKVKNYPISLITNPDFSQLKNLYAQAKIFWHAAGFGEDINNHPDRAEHFGITTVEAMAAGCVPVVFSGGGQREIVQHETNGILWETIRELTEKTMLLINNDEMRQKMSLSAVQRAKKYSVDHFFADLNKLL